MTYAGALNAGELHADFVALGITSHHAIHCHLFSFWKHF